MPKKIDIEQCRRTAEERGGDCLSGEYVNTSTKLHWRCAKEHEWDADWKSIKMGHWCPRCAAERLGRVYKIDIERCRQLAKKRGGQCLSKEYIDAHTKLRWQCSKSHEWDATWNNIQCGKWCPICGAKNRGDALRNDIDKCRWHAMIKKGELLSKEYNNAHTTLHWRCAQNHDWWASWNSVQQGKWCPVCAGHIPITLEICVEQAKKKGGKCLSTEYIDSKTKMLWRCGEGHEWYANWNNIHTGKWCPYCNLHLMEDTCRVIFKTIYSKPFPKCRPFKGSRLELDGYNEELKLAFEYDGAQHRTGRFANHEHDPHISERDKEKERLCRLSHISLVRINDREVTDKILVEVIIKKLQERALLSTIPPEDVLSRLRNPTDAIYQEIYGALYLNQVREICARHIDRTTGRTAQLLDTVWAGSNHKYNIRCEFNHLFKTSHQSVVGQNTWCPFCCGHAPISLDICKKYAKEKGGECISTEYINSQTRLRWRCKDGHEWNAVWNSIQRGTWCPVCSTKRRGDALRDDIDSCICMAQQRGGQCISPEYVDCKTKLHWQCAMGHEWDATWSNIQRGGWCPVCAGHRPIVIERCKHWASERGGECLSMEYIDSKTKLHWRCEKNHEWHAVWGNIQQGQWCPKCAATKRGLDRRVGIDRCRQIAIDRGGLCLSPTYDNSRTKLHWRCARGHEWKTVWANVQQGEWCPVCGRGRTNKIQSDKNIGIGRCKTVALEREGICLSTEYQDCNTPMYWYCNKHRYSWWSTARKVVKMGHWCPKCGRARVNNAAVGRKIGLERCKQIALERNGQCLSQEYIDGKTAMRWRCNKHETEWSARASNVFHGTWCPKCGREKTWAKRRTNVPE